MMHEIILWRETFRNFEVGIDEFIKNGYADLLLFDLLYVLFLLGIIAVSFEIFFVPWIMVMILKYISEKVVYSDGKW